MNTVKHLLVCSFHRDENRKGVPSEKRKGEQISEAFKDGCQVRLPPPRIAGYSALERVFSYPLYLLHVPSSRDACQSTQPPYWASPVRRAVIRREIGNVRVAGVIEPTNTDWSSPIVFELKKYGSLRFFKDYRRLSAITIRHVYTIMHIDDSLESLGGMKIISTLDCNSGY